MNWKGSASSLVTKRCIRIERVSAAEYFQGAFGQKAARSAIEPQWLFRLVRIGRGLQVDALSALIHGLEAVSLARTAPANQHEGAILRGFKSGVRYIAIPTILEVLFSYQ